MGNCIKNVKNHGNKNRSAIQSSPSNEDSKLRQYRRKSFRHHRSRSKPQIHLPQIRGSTNQNGQTPTNPKVSSKERTFIECIDRIRYAGGWEESIKSLEGLGGLSFEKLLHLTLKQGRESLNRRVGYVLELLKNRSPFYEHLNEKLLNKIAEKTNRSPQYLICGKKGPLNKRWNLYIPEDFEEKLRGI